METKFKTYGRLDLVCTKSGQNELILLVETVLAATAGPVPFHIFFTMDAVNLIPFLQRPRDNVGASGSVLHWLDKHGWSSPGQALSQVAGYAASTTACKTWCEAHNINCPESIPFSSLPLVLSASHQEHGQILLL